MNAKKRLEFSKRFFRNMAAHEDYIAKDNPAAAKKVIDLIYKTAESLETQPMTGRAGDRDGTRELVITKYPYTLIYKLTADKVRIVAVIHQSQQNT